MRKGGRNMTTPDAVEIMREVYRYCSELYPSGVQNAYLYGSYARGDYDDESDVDILLTVDADSEEIAKHRAALAAITSELSLRHDVTVSVSAKPLQQFQRYCSILPFYKNVLQEGVRYHAV